jgi:hypothetical protein
LTWSRLLPSGGLLILAGGVSLAEVDEIIADCASRASQDARISCLEAALHQLAGGEVAAEPPTASPAPPETHSANEDEAAAGLGQEQVEARNRSKSEAPVTLRATVVDFDFVGYQRLRVQLDNGQVWRQIDGDRTSVERGLRNETSFDVEMWETSLGGYRMRILPLERTIRVERLE